jgi:hypothetical protein
MLLLGLHLAMTPADACEPPMRSQALGGTYILQGAPIGLASSTGPATWDGHWLEAKTDGPAEKVGGTIRLRYRWQPDPEHPGPPPKIAVVGILFKIGHVDLPGVKSGKTSFEGWLQPHTWVKWNPGHEFEVSYDQEIVSAGEGQSASIRIWPYYRPISGPVDPVFPESLKKDLWTWSMKDHPVLWRLGAISAAFREAVKLGEHKMALEVLDEQASAEALRRRDPASVNADNVNPFERARVLAELGHYPEADKLLQSVYPAEGAATQGWRGFTVAQQGGSPAWKTEQLLSCLAMAYAGFWLEAADFFLRELKKQAPGHDQIPLWEAKLSSRRIERAEARRLQGLPPGCLTG